MTRLTLTALAFVALATPANANISLKDQRSHPGIVVDPRGLEYYLKQPAVPFDFGLAEREQNKQLPPPPAASTDPWWVPAKRVGV